MFTVEIEWKRREMKPEPVSLPPESYVSEAHKRCSCTAQAMFASRTSILPAPHKRCESGKQAFSGVFLCISMHFCGRFMLFGLLFRGKQIKRR